MRLIDADAFAQYLRENIDIWKHPEALDWAICKLGYAPTVDAVPVVHGRWVLCFDEWCEKVLGDKCSVCGFEHHGLSIDHYNRCPNCGAHMD